MIKKRIEKIISFLYDIKLRYFLYESYSPRWGLQIYSFEFCIWGHYLRRVIWLTTNRKLTREFKYYPKLDEDDWFVRMMVDSLVTHYYYLTTLSSSLRVKVLCKYGEKSYATIDTLIIKLTRSNKLRN